MYWLSAVIYSSSKQQQIKGNTMNDFLVDIIEDLKERITSELDGIDHQDIANGAEQNTPEIDTYEFCDDVGIDIHDMMHEVADDHTPIYNGDLMDLAKENFELMTTTPELGPAFDGEATPINIIAANVFEWILEGLNEWAGDDDDFCELIEGYMAKNEIVLDDGDGGDDVGGPSYANYHRAKEGK